MKSRRDGHDVQCPCRLKLQSTDGITSSSGCCCRQSNPASPSSCLGGAGKAARGNRIGREKKCLISASMWHITLQYGCYAVTHRCEAQPEVGKTVANVSRCDAGRWQNAFTSLKIPWEVTPVRVRSPARPLTTKGLAATCSESFFLTRENFPQISPLFSSSCESLGSFWGSA
jgi:hypothetical protein